jgi:uncharacterized membrane protein YfhO
MDNPADKNAGIKRIISYMLTALLPIIIMGVAFALNGVYPFGSRILPLSDFLYQYYPFISDFWHKLHEGNSLLWSWTAGGGHDYVSHFAYYLTSPFNLLAALLPHTLLRGALTVLMFVKLGLAGLFMNIYLRYVSKREDILLPAFSSMYALCAFALGYYCNIIWFDTFALLPLVILGVHKLVDEGKIQLYVLSLAGAVIFNFYIGFFVCVFTAIWFFILCFTQKPKSKEFAKKLAVIAVFSTLAIGLTAFLTLPAYRVIQHTFGVVYGNMFPASVSLRHSFFAVLGNFIAFTPPTFLFGLPNVASGMFSILLLPLFFLTKKVPLREKLAYLFVMLFLIASTNVNVLDYMWHGFSYPSGYPARYSFLITFILITMAYRAYTLTDGFSKKDISAMGGGGALLIVMAALGPQETEYVIGSAVLAGVYVGLFAFLAMGSGANKGAAQYKSKDGKIALQPHRIINRSRLLKLALFVLILTELTCNAFITVKAMEITDEDFPSHYSDIQQLLKKRRPAKNDFYRTDTDIAWRISYSDTSLYGYNGINIWNTVIDAGVSSFMEGLGLPSLGIGCTYYYTKTSPLTDAFLNMRYLIDFDYIPSDNCVYWHKAGQAGDLVLFENNRYLPLGFMVKAETAGFKGFAGAPYRPLDDPFERKERLAGLNRQTNGCTPFNAQNDLFKRATGLNDELFKTVDATNVESKNYKILAQQPGEFTFDTSGNSTEGVLFFDYEMPRDGYLYVYAWVEGADKIQIALDFSLLREIVILRPYIYRAGSFKQGDLITISALSQAQSGEAWVYAAVLDQELFEQGFALLADETLELTEFSDTKISGRITVKEDGLLYTSIPHAGLWLAFVDGAQAEIITIDGAMAALWLDAGKHTVEFRYHNSAFICGAIIGIAAALLFLALIAYRRIKGLHLIPQ